MGKKSTTDDIRREVKPKNTKLEEVRVLLQTCLQLLKQIHNFTRDPLTSDSITRVNRRGRERKFFKYIIIYRICYMYGRT